MEWNDDGTPRSASGDSPMAGIRLPMSKEKTLKTMDRNNFTNLLRTPPSVVL